MNRMNDRIRNFVTRSMTERTLLEAETVKAIIARVDAADIDGYVRFSLNKDGSLKLWSRQEVKSDAHVPSDSKITASGRVLAYLLTTTALEQNNKILVVLQPYTNELTQLGSPITPKQVSMFLEKFAGENQGLKSDLSRLFAAPKSSLFNQLVSSDRKKRGALLPRDVEQLRALGKAIEQLRTASGCDVTDFHRLLGLKNADCDSDDIAQFEQGRLCNVNRLSTLMRALGGWLDATVTAQKLLGEPITSEQQKEQLAALSLQVKDMAQYFLFIAGDEDRINEFEKAMKKPSPDTPGKFTQQTRTGSSSSSSPKGHRR